MLTLFTRCLVATLLALLVTAAHAAYPERPITLIVPWGAGGGTDATARIIGSLLEKELGQPVNVINRTGGSGVDRKSTRLNSSHVAISYAVFCLKKKKKHSQESSGVMS